MTPQPAKPSGGANFYWFNDLPEEGWEVRWSGGWVDVRDFEFPDSSWLVVVARPKPEPLVAVMLPKRVVEYGAVGCGMRYEEKRTFFDACRKALESDS